MSQNLHKKASSKILSSPKSPPILLNSLAQSSKLSSPKVIRSNPKSPIIPTEEIIE